MQSGTNNATPEKRTLASFPETPNSVKTLKRYPEIFDLYYKDNFGFRENMLWYNTLKYQLGNSPSEQVILGKYGWLFFSGEPFTDLKNSVRGLRKFSETDLQQYATVLIDRHQWLAARGIKYLLIIAPNKHSIYREYLPDSLFQVNKFTMTDQFFTYIKKHTRVPVLDLREQLISSKSADHILYYRTDTHWNHFGSNIAQFEIAKMLATFYPDNIKPELYEKSRFLINPVNGGDLATLIGQKTNYHEFNPNPLLDPCSRRSIPLDGDFSQTFTTKCKKSPLTALVFRDSFFEYLYQFISVYFKQVTFISERIEYSTLSKYIALDKPDIVIEEWAERFLVSIPEVEAEFSSAN